MNRPRLFISAVSEELRTARQNAASTVYTLGYDSISQDDFPTGHGELRQWLREQIDSCEGLIQLVGNAYGAEPPEMDPEYGRVSYTQLEFFYAYQQKKKTWLIFVGEGCHRDKPMDQLDLPRQPVHSDPSGYQAERQKLQQDYIAGLKKGNHLRYTANNDTELQNIVLRMRDELRELRQHWEEWLKKDAEFKHSMTDKIAHLLQATNGTQHKELAEADATKGLKSRLQLRADVHAARNNLVEMLHANLTDGIKELIKQTELPQRGEFDALVQLAGQLSLQSERDEQYVSLIELALANNDPTSASKLVQLLSLSTQRDKAWGQVFHYHLARCQLKEAATILSNFTTSDQRDRARKELIEAHKALRPK
jgi:hypothetical protein